MILDVLTKDTIRTGVEAEDWREVGRIAGELLVKKESVKPEYVESMIKTVEEIGPYIVIAPGIAFFHGRPEAGVKEISLSLVTLKKGIYFGSQDNDPVYLAFAFGATDKETHLNLLAQLSSLLEDGEVVDRLKEAETPEDILAIIKEKLNN